MIVAPSSRGRLSFRHVTRHLTLPTSNSSSIGFRSLWSRQYRHISSPSSSIGGRRIGQTKLMVVPLLDNFLSSGWNATTSRYHSTSSAVMTNKVLDWKTGGRVNSKKTLYDASRETENCGVGLIASLKSVPSRDIVEKADEMLVRMAHRGGCGCDPASGDGSGMYRLC
jgi:Glutamine amidotransferases class-II